MTTSNRHPFALLGAAASLITVLGFVGIKGLDDDGHQPTQTSATGGTPAPGPTSTRDRPASTEVTCTVTDELGDGQKAETLRLTIGGSTYRLSIDTRRPRQRLTLRYTRPARLDYLIMADTLSTDGTLRRGGGRGSIACSGGEAYAVAGDYDADPARIILERS